MLRIITGNALAHAKINRKIGNSIPSKTVTHEDFNLTFCTRDYAGDITHQCHHATFGSNRLIRGFFHNAPSSNRCTDSYADGSNDVFPPKDGPFKGQDDG